MLLCPADSTNRSRPAQSGSAGLCRIAFWNSVYATGARLIAVPGWPLPTLWTASIASTLAVSTARLSSSVQSSLLTSVRSSPRRSRSGSADGLSLLTPGEEVAHRPTVARWPCATFGRLESRVPVGRGRKRSGLLSASAGQHARFALTTVDPHVSVEPRTGGP